MGILNQISVQKITTISFKPGDIALLIAQDLGKDPKNVKVSYELKDNTDERYYSDSGSYNPTVVAINVTITE
jgi:hypothetical protein